MNILRSILIVCSVVVSVSFQSCLTSETTITVHKDGSANIQETFSVDTSVIAMMISMQGISSTTSPSNEEISIEQKADSLFRKNYDDQLLSLASTSKTTEISYKRFTENGLTGYRAEYTIDDINTFVLDGNRNKLMGKNSSNSPLSRTTSFKLQKGSPNVLVVKLPSIKEAHTKKTTTIQQTEKELRAQLLQAKSIMGGTKIRQILQVDGDVVSNTASFAQGNTITLLDLQMGDFLDAVLADNKLMKSLEKDKNSSAKMIQHMNKSGKIKIEPKSSFSVAFTPKK